MMEPGFEQDPADPPQFLPRLIKMLQDSGVVDDLEKIPVKQGIFHAMKTFTFIKKSKRVGKEDTR